MDMQAILDRAVRDGVFPGCVARLPDGTVLSAGDAARCDLWDLASVSKVVATTTLAMLAVDRGALDLDRPVAHYWPGAAFPGPVRALLLHEAGYPAFRAYHLLTKSREEVLASVRGEPGGGKNVYSDLSMIALAAVLEGIEGQRLDRAFAARVAEPLGLHLTGFRPAADGWGVGRRIAPTERVEEWRTESAGEWITGVVHDPTAWRMDGVAGHAGLFSTLDELTIFLTALVGERISPRWREWGRRASDRSSRALGWDTYTDGTFGHTGFTGTSVRIEPTTGRFAILLSNRVHPTAANRKILDFRPIFHAAAFGD